MNKMNTNISILYEYKYISLVEYYHRQLLKTAFTNFCNFCFKKQPSDNVAAKSLTRVDKGRFQLLLQAR
jgi:hypothetical protein